MWWRLLVILVLKRQRQEKQKFKVIPSYIESSISAWAAGNPAGGRGKEDRKRREGERKEKSENSDFVVGEVSEPTHT